MLAAIAQFSAVDPELLVGYLGAAVVASYALWNAVRWFRTGASRPDPWSEEVEREIAAADAPRLCHHCLAGHEPSADFCPDCGAPVGLYTNLLPFPYLFSIGHTLRIGTTERFKRTPLTIIGFLVFGAIHYSLFAPIYWVQLCRNLLRPNASADPSPPDAPES